jgi:hypothetical protein
MCLGLHLPGVRHKILEFYDRTSDVDSGQARMTLLRCTDEVSFFYFQSVGA